MNSNIKLLVGIIIGLVLGLGVWAAVSFSDNTPKPIPPATNAPTVTPHPTPTPTAGSTPIVTSTPTGQQTVTGRFQIYSIGLIPDVVFFEIDKATATLPQGTYFAFRNQATARTALRIDQAGQVGSPGCDYIAGKAEIIISDFRLPEEPGDSPSGATLVKVNKITQPAECTKGTP